MMPKFLNMALDAPHLFDTRTPSGKKNTEDLLAAIEDGDYEAIKLMHEQLQASHFEAIRQRIRRQKEERGRLPITERKAL